jgi:sugar phosphate isomerase/epimerase
MSLRIRIGNQTNCHAPWRHPWDYALAEGFDAFEWFSDRGRSGWGEELMADADRDDLRRIAEKNDLLFSVHAPYAADPVTPEGARAIGRSIQFAGAVGAGVVNLHLFPQRGARPFADALVPLVRGARAAGVRLSLENTPDCSPDDFNAVFGVLTAVPEAAGRVGLCFDMGHANLHAATRNDYNRYIDLLGEHVPVVHWHAHENWGDRDSHLTLFTGPAAHDDGGLRGLVRRLLRRGFAGSVVLEQWPQPPQLLADACRRLRQLIDDVAREGPSPVSPTRPAERGGRQTPGRSQP